MARYDVSNADSGNVSQNTTGVDSVIWKKSIPANQIISTNVGNIAPPLLRLYTEDTFSGDGSTTTFSLNDNVVDNPRLGDTDTAVIYVDGSLVTNYSIDYDNNEIDFDSAPASGTDNIEVFYLFRDGQLDVAVQNNDQAGKEETIIEEAVRGLHAVDQLDNPVEIDTAHMVKPNNLVVKLNSDTQISTDSRAPHKLRIPYKKNVASESQVEDFQATLGNSA